MTTCFLATNRNTTALAVVRPLSLRKKAMGKGRRLYDTPDNWSDLVGMPDDWDKRNIQALIRNFEHEKFMVKGQVITGKQLINAVVATARWKQEKATNAFNRKTGVRDKDSGYR